MSRAPVWALALGLSFGVAAPLTAQTPTSQSASSSLEALKEQADAAYRQRDFAKAISTLDRVLTQNSQDHVALYLRGSSRVELGVESGNVDLVRQGIADAREAIRFEAKGKPEYYLPYIYGMSHLAAMENKPSHAKTALSVVDSILEREDLEKEQEANLYFQRAHADLQLKDYKACENDLNESIGLEPKHLAAHMLFADVAVKSKSAAEAVAAYGKVVSEFPDNPVVYNNRGMYLQTIGKSQEAIADYTKAIQLDAKFIPAYINRGFVYLENNDPVAAEKAFTEALAVDASQMGALNLRARARMNQGKMQDALADYRRVVELAPTSPMPYADLGFAQFFASDYSGALQSFKSALRIDPKLRFLEPWKLACEIRISSNGQIDTAPYAATLAKPEGSRDWPDSLILFQLGKIDVTQLFKAVHPTDQDAQQAQMCEGYYFIGMELVRRGQAQNATAYFQHAVQRKLPNLSAYRGAMVALQGNEGVTR